MEKKLLIPRTVFVGGGSGGHLTIAKGLIDYLRDEEYDLKNLLFVGSKLGMINAPGKSFDEKRIPEFGVRYKFIRSGKLHRSWKFVSIKLLFGIIPGFWDSFKILRSFKPKVIFATGGYVVVPFVILARLFGIKVILHEQTMKAGMANKIASYFASKILVTFESSVDQFPTGRVECVGNILKREYKVIPKKLNAEMTSVVDSAKSSNSPLIYITGGSLGAHRINKLFMDNLESFVGKYCLIWQVGENTYHNDLNQIRRLIRNLSPNLRDRIHVVGYIQKEIGYIVKNADIVIARPGANTIFELASFAKKAIFIPLTVSSKSDQLLNANWYISKFTSSIVMERDMSWSYIQKTIDRLLVEEQRGDAIIHDNVEEKIIKHLWG